MTRSKGFREALAGPTASPRVGKRTRRLSDDTTRRTRRHPGRQLARARPRVLLTPLIADAPLRKR